MKKIVLIALSALVLVLILMILILNFIVYPRVVRHVRNMVKTAIHQVAVRTKRTVQAGEIIVSQKQVTIKNLEIMDKNAKYALFNIKSIKLKISPFQILRNQQVGPLIVTGASLKIRLNKHKPDDLIDLWHAIGNKKYKAKTSSSNRKILTNKRIKKMHLSGLLIKGLSIEIKDQNSPNHVITLDHINGTIKRLKQGMDGRLNGYLWISQGGITRISGEYHDKKLTLDLASGINLPAWLFPGADKLSFRSIVIRLNKGVSLAFRNVGILIGNNNMPIPSKIRHWIKDMDMQAQEIGVETRIIPLYPLKIWVKKLEAHGHCMIHGKTRALKFTDAEAGAALSDQGYSINMSGDLAIQRGKKGPVNIKISGDPVSWLREVTLDMKGIVVPSALAVFDRRMIVLPGSTGAAHLEIADTLDGGWNFNGRVELKNFGYFSTRICLSPVFGITTDASFDGMLTSDYRHLMVNMDSFKLNGILFTGSFIYNRSGNSPAKMKLDVDLPKQGCDKIVAAIPRVMRPRLPDMKAKGSMSMHASISTDLKNISTRTKFNAKVNMDNCHVITLGSIVDLKMLEGPFVLKRPDPKNKKTPILIGPGTDNYVPIEKIPVWTQQAALATEDMAFFRHHGFKPGLIRRAIALNLDKGWYVYGGSTITQQLAKNLFLSTEKSLSRKLEEAIITWQMEKILTKEKILELYLNCIEYGIGVYGIKQAAKVYFNKTPEQLSPLESAWIMATKPSPKYAFRVYERGRFNKWWVNRMRNILLRLWKEMHIIDEHAFLNAAPYLPTFYYADKGVYRKPGISGKFEMPQGFPKELPDRDIKNELKHDIRGVAPPIMNIRRIESWW